LSRQGSINTIKLAKNASVEPGSEDIQITLMMFIHLNQFKEFTEVYKKYKA